MVSKNDPYSLPLPKRRMEAGIVAALTVFTIGWTGFNISGVVTELTTNPSLICSYEGGEDNLVILVADMLESGSGPSLLISDKIYESLVLGQKAGQYDVCRLTEPIKLSTIAAEKAQEHEADIVIWGRIDVIYEIHLEAPALSNPHRTLSEVSSEEAASVEFQLKEPGHISHVTKFTISEILFLRGQVSDAQLNQNELLTGLARNGLDKTNPKMMAEGYFLLGLFYDPDFSENPDEERALDAYQKAAELDPTLYAASFNRGLILLFANRTEEAVTEFTHVIEGNEDGLKADALINRAGLLSDPAARLHDLNLAIEIDPAEGYFFRGIERMNQEDYQGAIEDLEQAVNADPQGYYNYHLLGQAQLYAGEMEAAKQTYVRILPTLDEETRTQVIIELQEAAQATPEIAPAVEQIVIDLQSAKLP